jgi:hypothetical protein
LLYSLLVFVERHAKMEQFASSWHKENSTMKWPSLPTQEAQGEAIEGGNLEKQEIFVSNMIS